MKDEDPDTSGQWARLIVPAVLFWFLTKTAWPLNGYVLGMGLIALATRKTDRLLGRIFHAVTFSGFVGGTLFLLLLCGFRFGKLVEWMDGKSIRQVESFSLNAHYFLAKAMAGYWLIPVMAAAILLNLIGTRHCGGDLTGRIWKWIGRAGAVLAVACSFTFFGYAHLAEECEEIVDRRRDFEKRLQGEMAVLQRELAVLAWIETTVVREASPQDIASIQNIFLDALKEEKQSSKSETEMDFDLFSKWTQYGGKNSDFNTGKSLITAEVLGHELANRILFEPETEPKKETGESQVTVTSRKQRAFQLREEGLSSENSIVQFIDSTQKLKIGKNAARETVVVAVHNKVTETGGTTVGSMEALVGAFVDGMSDPLRDKMFPTYDASGIEDLETARNAVLETEAYRQYRTSGLSIRDLEEIVKKMASEEWGRREARRKARNNR